MKYIIQIRNLLVDQCRIWKKENHDYHNNKGPAVEYMNGKNEYWINNHYYSKKEYIDLLHKCDDLSATYLPYDICYKDYNQRP